MDVTFIDFVAAFSYALDAISPEYGHRSARRAWIVMHLTYRRNFDLHRQQRLFLAALLFGLRQHSKPSEYAPLFDASLPAFRKVAKLIDGTGLRAECALLQLAEDLDLLTYRMHPKGEYPDRVIATLCEGIGSRYELDDVLALREMEADPSFWKELSSASLVDAIADLAPMVRQPLDEATLLQLARFLSTIVDNHCRSVCRHSMQVAELSAGMAKLYGFSSGGILRIRIAGLLHDVGKLALPASLLNKSGPLTAYEARQLSTHAEQSRDILSRIPGMGDIARLAGSHHERPDGNGYPSRLRGSQLDLAQRILCVANCYSALREPRSSKPGLPLIKSLNLLQDRVRAGALDADVVDTFISWLTAPASLLASA